MLVFFSDLYDDVDATLSTYVLFTAKVNFFYLLKFKLIYLSAMFYMRAFRAQTTYFLRILSKFAITLFVGGLYAA